MATILVVEPDWALRQLLRVLLELAGHNSVEPQHVVPTWSLSRWFAAIHAQVKAAAPDLVVIDTILKLGDIHTWDARETSGSELLERLRADPETARIPILAMSTLPQHAGADAFLSKPFDPDDLLVIVHALIERAPRESA